jgi:hypothetical protein
MGTRRTKMGFGGRGLNGFFVRRVLNSFGRRFEGAPEPGWLHHLPHVRKFEPLITAFNCGNIAMLFISARKVAHQHMAVSVASLGYNRHWPRHGSSMRQFERGFRHLYTKRDQLSILKESFARRASLK